MSDLSCETCPFFSDGSCHHVSNASEVAMTVGNWWWCSEHPLAPGQRDRIAEIVVQGMAANSHDDRPANIVEESYRIADAMMAKRAKQEEPSDS
jgi:hypothetical protein